MLTNWNAMFTTVFGMPQIWTIQMADSSRMKVQRIKFFRTTTLLAILFILAGSTLHGQTDSLALEKIRKESGVDPTKIQSRVGYSFQAYDRTGTSGQINNKLSLTLGVGKWSLGLKYEAISKTSTFPEKGFKSGFGDIRFSTLNAFYVHGKHALAASAEFSMPTAKPGFGTQQATLSPSLTYAYTISSSLILAVQPQYLFSMMKGNDQKSISVVTIRSFLAYFDRSGYFLVFEPRPVFDFGNGLNYIVLSPIAGKSIGGGFNLLLIMEYPMNAQIRQNSGVLYQFGFNKNF
jgi:hypothetical protein